MLRQILSIIQTKFKDFVLSVPVRWKIIGIGILPVIILGASLNYWVTTGLSDWLSYILTDVRVEAAMNAGGRSVTFVTAMAAFLSIILLMLLVYILNRPLEELKKTAGEVASGKFETRAEVWANDEIGALAISLNQMIDNFVAIQDDLSQTNRQLETINRIALAADREVEIHDVLFIALESILDLLELEFGWVYLYDPEIHKHHLASWKGVPEEIQATFLANNEQDLCSCQKELEKGDLASEVSIQSCSRLESAGFEKNKSRHITIPIAARNVQFGVINLHYPFADPLDEERILLLESFGAQISEIVANAWLQIKLREKEAARMLLLDSLVTAQEDERQNLARELHDHAGQGLTSLLIRLKALENQCDEPSLKDSLNHMQGLVSDTIDQIRDLSYSLRPPALEEFGLGTAIGALVEETTEQTDLRIRFKNRIEEKIPSKVETVLYRIVQEGLTNVIRHAEASQVVIELEPRENLLYLKIEDNGKGFDPAEAVPSNGKRHLGLISMNERTELIGGVLEMYSSVGGGTKIEVKIPLLEMEILHAG
ncbi:MAG: histidine kinase [Anaerolineales bacterium]|jgi:signal transduction histidine kinase